MDHQAGLSLAFYNIHTLIKTTSRRVQRRSTRRILDVRGSARVRPLVGAGAASDTEPIEVD
jgi:hypothetical protein